MEISLFPADFTPPNPQMSVSKKGYAEMKGVSQARVSQWIASGLPLNPAGRIIPAQGDAWLAANLDPNRRRISIDAAPAAFPDDAAGHGAVPHLGARAELAAQQARLMKIKADRAEGRSLDRAATLRAIEAFGRAQRDGWIGWTNRAAVEMAAELGVDIGRITAVLDRLVREQLQHLARAPLKGLTEDEPDSRD